MTGTAKRGRTRVRDDIGVTRTLDRGLALLEFLSVAREATLSALARGVDISPTTASRLLDTMKARGFVDHDLVTGTFTIGMRAYTVGSGVLQARRLDRIGLATMRVLAGETGMAVNLGVRDGQTAVYIEQVEAPGVVRFAVQPGMQLPLHATAMGKVLAAWLWSDALDAALGLDALTGFTLHTTTDRQKVLDDLQAVRMRGWATDDQEFQTGLFCVAAPVRDRKGAVVAGLSLSSLVGSINLENIDSLGSETLRAANEISTKLGWIEPVAADPRDDANAFSD